MASVPRAAASSYANSARPRAVTAAKSIFGGSGFSWAGAAAAMHSPAEMRIHAALTHISPGPQKPAIRQDSTVRAVRLLVTWLTGQGRGGIVRPFAGCPT